MKKIKGERLFVSKTEGKKMVTASIPPAALSAEESARYIGVPRSTFDRIAKSEPLPNIRMGNRKVFRVETLDNFLRQRESKATV